MSVPVVLIDPLTLVGRELLELLQTRSDLDLELRYLHTAEEDEHQIAELGGDAALVPPIVGPQDLEGCSAIVVASDRDLPRLDHLEAFLDEAPEVPLLDCGRSDRLRHRTRPAGHGSRTTNGGVHLRVAHPAAIMADEVASTVRHLGLSSVSICALEPASHRHDDAVEILAAQAVSRLRGEPVTRTVGGHVLAFSAVAAEHDALAEDAGVLLSGTGVIASRVVTGAFHGHMAVLTLAFDTEVDDSDVRDALEASPMVVLVDHPASLDAVVGGDHVAVTPPALSADGRLLTVTAMADGLRVGGALTGLQILRTLL